MKKTETHDPLYYQVKKATDVSHLPSIEGIEFDKKVTFDTFVQSLATTGLQASELSHAIEVAKMMKREKVTIFLSFTSNMISSGVRETIKWLVKHKLVHVLSTSAGGVEEDVIKSLSPFKLGTFYASGDSLLSNGIGRIGNIYTTTDQYAFLEKFMRKVFDLLYDSQKKTGKPSTPSDVARTIGMLLEKDDAFDHNSSYLYWAYKNDISVFCPGIVDGAIGDMLYFYKNTHKDFVLDVSNDHKKIIDFVLSCEKTGGIILGGGISKHYILNANIFREGFDYTVYLSTAQSFDGSDSGGSVEEAVTWMKIKNHSPRVKVNCDASIAFPILVYATFVSKN
ncbi:MAG TPA: deoxyhypusine synthase [Acidobacteriota bacterium]|nr:deoxyhypusine synthase [Acidobacteriota bacterium]